MDINVIPHMRGKSWQYWHRVVFLSSLGWVFMYADRAVLSPLLPLIRDEWNLSQADLGSISSMFFLIYAAVQVPVGWLSDWAGRRLVFLVPGFILFGLGTLGTGLAGSFTWILIAAIVTGLGQGTYYPTQFSLSTEVVPPARRGLAAAFINSGQAVGISLGLLVASVIALDHNGGWRLPFIVLAIPTVLVAFVIWFGIDRNHDRRATRLEVPTNPRVARRDVWAPKLIILYVVNFCSNYGFFVVLTWLPFFLMTDRGYAGGDVGWISSLVPWAAVPGGILAGMLSDRMKNRRLVLLVMFPLAAMALVLIPMIESGTVLVVTLVAYGFMGKLAIDPVLAAMLADICRVEAYGRVFGVFNFAAMLSSVIAPYLTGLLADIFGSLAVGFLVAAVVLLIGFASILFIKKVPTETNYSESVKGV